jgi:LSD1 subclass zinc finger protein
MDMKPAGEAAVIKDSLTCKGCGAILHFAPGTNSLKCQYCGVANEIVLAEVNGVIQSVDYDAFLTSVKTVPLNNDLKIVKCSQCGSETNLRENSTAEKCAFCTAPLVLELARNKGIVKPHYLLPFILDEKAAVKSFKDWLAGLWFAPSDLVKKVEANSALKGIYMPYWTYDSDTITDYTGKKGKYYYESETYTVTVNGKEETRTRSVRRTSWSYASGTVKKSFDDVTVPASKSLPGDMLTELGPWEFEKLLNYDERYISGFSAETFQIDPEQGLETAKDIMEVGIREAIENDIGGDEQQIDSLTSRYYNVAIKYVMLPVWVSAYSYNSKIFQFTVNACTGEVIGKRPYSVMKIVLAIIAGLILLAAIFILIANAQGNSNG